MSTRLVPPPTNSSLDEQQRETAALRASRWLAVGVGGYLLSQSFLIPLAPLGPSWSIWPTLADLAIGGLVLAAALTPPGKVIVSRANREIWGLLCWLYVACVLSFFIVNLTMGSAGRGLAVDEGVYYLYRMTQFMIVYWATMRVAFSPGRERALFYVTAFVYIVTCAACLLTFLDVLPGTRIVAHLPAGRVAGPWGFFHANQAQGLGFVGHNHAYVSAQVLMLLALTLNLSGRSRPLFNGSMILLGVVAAFATGSRAGLAATLLFAVCMVLRTPVYAIVAGVVVGLVALFLPQDFMANEQIADLASEQGKIVDPMQATQFRARRELWRRWAEFLARSPQLLITGVGFGGTRGDAAPGVSPHSQPYMVLVEFGILGLIGFAWLVLIILDRLRKTEPPPKPVLWATISLLLASATQETFYPVPALGHFVGFYFCTLAIALRQPNRTLVPPSLTGGRAGGFPLPVGPGRPQPEPTPLTPRHR
ncbi:MAG: O-antigen ligase family protein [Pirellulales bacterium]